MNGKTIAFACDHGGFILKEALTAHLKEKGYEILDFGAYSADRVEYPAVGEPACRAVVAGEARFALLVCGTGIGMSLVANKIHGIRAACCSEPYSAKMTRLHNDANVLCIGARVIGEATALDILDAFLDHEFEGGRHAERVAMITAIEERG
ncbi:MAG: ribose 5-phosphate isomerase B [Clostridia bacterium]|nr:ribose 5-phosphate isomerase B [Clostridia bacterium]